MIDEIRVKNIALIREAELVPSAGLTVLTGETGAGKTALLSACKLLMGARADSAMVREGSPAAQVEGRLFTRAPLPRAVESEHGEGGEDGKGGEGVQAGEDAASPAAPGAAGETGAAGGTDGAELVVTRRLSADGRSRATLNGEMASVSELARTVGPLIELCGQHEQQALLRPAEHGRMLDAWADLDGADGAATAYRTAFARAAEAASHLEQVRQQASASHVQLEEARFALASIQAVNPQPGEYDELAEFLAKAENAEALARSSHGAAAALSDEGGALDALNTAIALLDDAARTDEGLGAYASSLREICFVAEDVARDMASYCESIDFDGATLAAAQERMGAFQGLMRSFGPTMDEVLARWEEADSLVSLVDDADEAIARAQAALDEAEEALVAAAAAYTEAREQAAPRFAAAVNEVMDQLEMGGASLVCAVEPLPREKWSAAGPAAVAFEFKPGKSMQARPLARIASGGEISRVMLAVKVVLGQKDGTETLIFDEVDAGVGGSVANALAAVLARLAQTHQVIAITHLAQVAVAADTHYTVSKTGGDAPETVLALVQGEAREREVARMLSGGATEVSLAHARELLGA